LPENGRRKRLEGDDPHAAPPLALDTGAPDALWPEQLAPSGSHSWGSCMGVASCPGTSRTQKQEADVTLTERGQREVNGSLADTLGRLRRRRAALLEQAAALELEAEDLAKAEAAITAAVELAKAGAPKT
jgi:hypothetical protein